jgi:hypothetical protein
MNDSMLEGISANLNESMTKVQSNNTFISSKAKPRDFKINPKCLISLNAQNYDRIEDMSQL